MPYEAETRIDLAQKLYNESVSERRERETHFDSDLGSVSDGY